jgi:hypothetical protein
VARRRTWPPWKISLTLSFAAPPTQSSLARRIAHFIDGGTLIGFALANALAEFEQRDVAEVLRVVEDAVDRKLADAGSVD